MHVCAVHPAIVADAIPDGARDSLLLVPPAADVVFGLWRAEAIVTGVLAGHNAVRRAMNKPLVTIPATISIGDAITYVREAMETEEGMAQKFTFSGATYFKHMKEAGLYTTDIPSIQKRVADAGMVNFFGQEVH